MTYRITQTIMRGQWANDDCFLKWLSANVAGAQIIRAENDPLNNGGPNDKRYYLWNNTQLVPSPKCPSDPQLVTRNGKNGWETLAEAEAILAYELGQSKVIADNVAAANAAAVSPGNIAASIVKDAEKAADAAGAALKSNGPWIVVGLVAAAAIAWKVLK